MRLRTKVFELYPRYYGSLSQLAHAMGMSVSQISRVRNGKRHINEAFLLGALSAFPQFSFSDLFYLGLESDGLVTEEALLESEERYRAIFEQAADSVVLIDAETGSFVEYNDRAHEALGYTREEFGKLRIADYEVIESAEEITKHIDKIIKEEATVFETRHRTKGGDIRDVQVSARAISLGGRCFIQSMWRDITERKRAEEALRESEEKLRRVFESAVDAIAIIDLQGVILDVNEKGMAMYGVSSKDEILGKNSLEFIAPRHHKVAMEIWRKAVKEGAIRDMQYTIVKANGSEVPGEISGSVLRDALGNPIGVVGITREITERKLAEEKLRESEERLKALIENAPDAIYVVDLNGKFIDVNRKAEELIGYTREQMIGRRSSDLGLLSEEYEQKLIVGLDKNCRGESTGPIEYQFIRKDGSQVSVEIMTVPVTRKGTIEVIAIVRDLTKRKLAEKALRESEEKLRRVFESAADAIAITDLQGVILDINEKGMAMYGVSSKDEILGKNSLELIAPRDHKAAKRIWRKAVKEGAIRDTQYTIVKANGSEVPVEINASVLRDALGKPAGFIGISRDITERKLAEEKLRESE